MERGALPKDPIPIGDLQAALGLGRSMTQPARVPPAPSLDRIQLDWSGSGEKVKTSPSPPCPACLGSDAMVHFVSVVANGEKRGSYECCPKCRSLRADPAGGSTGPQIMPPTQQADADFSQCADLLWQFPPTEVQSYCEFGRPPGLTLAFARDVLGWRASAAHPGNFVPAPSRAEQNALIEAQRPGDFPFDVVAAFRLIEQFDRPDLMLALMKSCMGAWSCLLITCRDCEQIQQGQRTGDGALALAAPYLRPVLYSRAGLEASLARQDFPWLEVTRDGKELVARAAFARPPVRAQGPLPQTDLERFLRDARSESGRTSP